MDRCRLSTTSTALSPDPRTTSGRKTGPKSRPPAGWTSLSKDKNTPLNYYLLPGRPGLKHEAIRVIALYAADLERHDLVRSRQRSGADVPGDGVEGASLSLPRQEGPDRDRLRGGSGCRERACGRGGDRARLGV